MLPPDRTNFAADPFGYSLLAWHKWSFEISKLGFPADLTTFPKSSDLKNPILWLCHASAIAEAATTLARTVPKWDHMPNISRSICDSQFCAVALMLVGYSLEISLKAMLLMKMGVEEYEAHEQKFRHHQLAKLAEFIPDLGSKDLAILKLLTHYTVWAGRYPDPGNKFDADTKEIFEISEREKISGQEVFSLAVRIMSHAKNIADNAKV